MRRSSKSASGSSAHRRIAFSKIEYLRALTGLDHLIAEFSVGGLPHEEAELNTRLFADRALRVLQRDPKFATPPEASASAMEALRHSMFAPA
jgi:hypothetical protein